MYYGDDHVAVSKTKMMRWSTLVDVAVMLYDEIQETDMRIFRLFPRKPRSSRRRRQQQTHGINLNGASTSTSWSHLFDLNSIPSTDDSETQTQRNPTNPNSPSSCLTNPNSLKIEKKKRRATQVIKPSGKAKKAKVAPLSWEGRETPEGLVHLMNDMNGADEPRLIFEKTLSQTDCDPLQSRLLMPFKTLIRNDFLTLVESSIVEEEQDINNNDESLGVGSILVDQKGVKWGVIFKRRDMRKNDPEKVSQNYALICGWSDMVKANGLKDGDNISVWSFRWRQVLCFAIVSPPTMA